MDARYADLETELCRIPEVTAARIVVNDDGKPTELHILALPDKHAKQVVRDIQSVAMASFGLDLDRRLISVVQLEGQETTAVGNGERRATMSDGAAAADMEPFGGGTSRVEDDEDRVVVDGVVTVRSGLTCVAEVTLARSGDRVKGRAEGTLASSAVLRIVAQATLDALRQLEPSAMRADVETAMIVRLGERSVALVTVVLVRPPYEEVMAGAAVVRAAGDHDAVARGVLHAINRRLSQIP